MTSQLSPVSEVLAQQHKRSVRCKALLDSLQDLAVEKIESAAQSLKESCSIKARGVWLTLLAARFAYKRPYKLSATAFFFGFDGNPQATPFNKAPFRPDGDTLAGKIPVSDAVFLGLLLARTGSLRTNGTQDNINELLDSAYPGSYVTDGQDMTMALNLIVDVLDDDLEIILQQKGSILKPAGVALDTQLIEFFGFDGTGVGFDQAPFSYL